jgi:hypothetical protein
MANSYSILSNCFLLLLFVLNGAGVGDLGIRTETEVVMSKCCLYCRRVLKRHLETRSAGCHWHKNLRHSSVTQQPKIHSFINKNLQQMVQGWVGLGWVRLGYVTRYIGQDQVKYSKYIRLDVWSCGRREEHIFMSFFLT